MTYSFLDELEVPRPPYRMSRPVIRLVAQEDEPTDGEAKENDIDALYAELNLYPEGSPEYIAVKQKISEQVKNENAGLYADLDAIPRGNLRKRVEDTGADAKEEPEPVPEIIIGAPQTPESGTTAEEEADAAAITEEYRQFREDAARKNSTVTVPPPSGEASPDITLPPPSVESEPSGVTAEKNDDGANSFENVADALRPQLEAATNKVLAFRPPPAPEKKSTVSSADVETQAYQSLQEAKRKFDRGEVTGNVVEEARVALEKAHVATEDEKRGKAGIPERTRSRVALDRPGSGMPSTEEVAADPYRGEDYHQADLRGDAHRDDFGGAPSEAALRVEDKRFVPGAQEVIPPVPTVIPEPPPIPTPVPVRPPPVIPLVPGLPKKRYKAGAVEAEGFAQAKAEQASNKRLQEQQERVNQRNMFVRAGYGAWRRVFESTMRKKQERGELAKIRREGRVDSANAYIGTGVTDRDVQRLENAATVGRFLEEDTEFRQNGEPRDELPPGPIRDRFLSAIKEYATGTITDIQFQTRKNVILAEMAGVGLMEINRSVIYAENMLEVARNIKEQLKHGETLNDIDDRIEIVIGRAKYGPKTEAHRDRVDKVMDHLAKNPVGNKIINELGVGVGLSVLYAGSVAVAERTLVWATGALAVPALGSGFVAGVRERFRITEQRAEIAREEASGEHDAKPEDRRRQEIIKSLYGMETAADMGTHLKDQVSRAVISGAPGEFNDAIRSAAEISARLKISEDRHIDLVSYSDPKFIERERYALRKTRNEALAQMDAILATPGGTFSLSPGFTLEQTVQAHAQTIEHRLIAGSGGITQRDALFKQFRRSESLKTGVKTAALAFGVGLAINEVMALAKTNLDGLLERVFKGKQPSAQHQTILRNLYERLTGQQTPVAENMVSQRIGAGSIVFPEGGNLSANIDGSYALHDGNNIYTGLHAMPDGKLSLESLGLLREHGFVVSEHFREIAGAKTETVTRPIHEWLKMWGAQHFDGVREHFNNMTRQFDLNELRLQYRGTGVGANGFEMDISKMRVDGSFIDGVTADLPALMKKGVLQLFISGSEAHSNTGFPIEVGTDGVAHIAGNAARLFSNANGVAKFLGRYVEVMVRPGTKPEDLAPFFRGSPGAIQALLTHRVPVFATAVGNGMDTITDVVRGSANVVVTEIRHIPDVLAVGLPGVIPAVSPLTAGVPKQPQPRRRQQGAVEL